MTTQLSENMWFMGVFVQTKSARTIRAQTTPLGWLIPLFLLIVIYDGISKCKIPSGAVTSPQELRVELDPCCIHLLDNFRSTRCDRKLDLTIRKSKKVSQQVFLP